MTEPYIDEDGRRWSSRRTKTHSDQTKRRAEEKRREKREREEQRFLALKAELEAQGKAGEVWECPCGDQPPKPGSQTIPVRTVVSQKVPKCPWCGTAFREEYQRPASVQARARRENGE